MPYKSREAQAANNRRWREENRDKVRSSHRAKALRREYGGDLQTEDVRWALDNPCAYCGGEACHVEHCTPLSRGGRNDADNVVGACSECNFEKGKLTVLEHLLSWGTPF